LKRQKASQAFKFTLPFSALKKSGSIEAISEPFFLPIGFYFPL